MRTITALMRASWYQQRSYRLALAMQLAGLLVMVFPLYLVTGALQPTMAETISAEADQLFAFVLVGSVALMFISTSMNSLSGAISGGISSGYFESLLMTRASVAALLMGMSSYGLVFTLVRAAVMVTAGWAIGATIVWSNAVPALFILALLVAAHFGIGMVAAALVIAFRTSGPLTQFVALLSTFFGGVYYPVSEIPSWLGIIAKFTPLAYGLSSLRRVLLQGESIVAVAGDLAILTVIGAVLVLLGSLAIRWALTYAKKSGTLGMY
jgi:ABC-2 type transport system permease protein